MKKRVIFIVLSLLVLSFFACDEFALPTAIEIKGNPSIRFVESINIGSMFTDLLGDAVNGSNTDGMTIISCENTDNFTFLAHMDLFSVDFESINGDIGNLDQFFPGMELQPGDIVNTPLPGDRVLFDGSGDLMTLPLSEIGSLLEGFEFTDYKTILYFSGSSFIKKAMVDINIYEVVNGVSTLKDSEKFDITGSGSDIENWKVNGYSQTTYPSGGADIDIPITGKDIAVSFKVYIPKGTSLSSSDFSTGGNIKVEAVIWLPFKLIAGASGAEISFPEGALFSSEDDLFGRESADSESMITDSIESLSLTIKLDNNPFGNAKLVVFSRGIEIENQLTDDSLPFIISEDDMSRINSPECFPFTPNFKLKFSPGGTLNFPRNFNATEFTFTAKLKYRIDLSSEEQ